LSNLLQNSDHVWILNYQKSAFSVLENTQIKSLIKRYIPENFIIQRLASGKPVAYCVDNTKIGAHFSISHSENLLVIAFSKYLVGVDIEFVKPRMKAHEIRKRYFSAQEPHENLLDFYCSWTAREAFIKSQGLRLSQISRVRVCDDTIGLDNKLDYHINFNLLDNNYLIALCRPEHNTQKISYFSDFLS
jgi:hypothetical protein